MRTLVIQSYRTSEVPRWIDTCLRSVHDWANIRGYDYRFYGDEIFERVPPWFREKTHAYPQIAADLGRLHLITEALEGDYERAIWLDADVLIFDPSPFDITLTSGFAFGRELWVQHDKKDALRLYRNVHNAFCVFCRDNAFLEFYRYACSNIMSQVEPGVGNGMAPQLIGPKFLSAIHNMMGLPLLDDIAMASPLVLVDLFAGGGAALELLHANNERPPRGVNLCASLVTNNDNDLDMLCNRLLDKPELISPAKSVAHKTI